MSFKIDFHVHTISFGKVFMTAEELREALPKRGLDGIAVTNFFNISHALRLKEELKEFVIIPGQEIWTNEGHIIGLNLKERIGNFKTPEETIDRIHDQGGVAVGVHPFLKTGVGKRLAQLNIDVYEVYNSVIGGVFIYNFLSEILARKINVPLIASSDTTDINRIGQSHTEVLTEDRQDILRSVLSGRVRLVKRPLPVPFKFILRNFLNLKNVEPCMLHAAPCMTCNKSFTVRLTKAKFTCNYCGKEEYSHIACSNGHYFCIPCISRHVSEQEHLPLFKEK